MPESGGVIELDVRARLDQLDADLKTADRKLEDFKRRAGQFGSGGMALRFNVDTTQVDQKLKQIEQRLTRVHVIKVDMDVSAADQKLSNLERRIQGLSGRGGMPGVAAGPYTPYAAVPTIAGPSVGTVAYPAMAGGPRIPEPLKVAGGAFKHAVTHAAVALASGGGIGEALGAGAVAAGLSVGFGAAKGPVMEAIAPGSTESATAPPLMSGVGVAAGTVAAAQLTDRKGNAVQMFSCPKCGSPNRLSAAFCTRCGMDFRAHPLIRAARAAAIPFVAAGGVASGVGSAVATPFRLGASAARGAGAVAGAIRHPLQTLNNWMFPHEVGLGDVHEAINDFHQISHAGMMHLSDVMTHHGGQASSDAAANMRAVEFHGGRASGQMDALLGHVGGIAGGITGFSGGLTGMASSLSGIQNLIGGIGDTGLSHLDEIGFNTSRMARDMRMLRRRMLLDRRRGRGGGFGSGRGGGGGGQGAPIGTPESVQEGFSAERVDYEMAMRAPADYYGPDVHDLAHLESRVGDYISSGGGAPRRSPLNILNPQMQRRVNLPVLDPTFLPNTPSTTAMLRAEEDADAQEGGRGPKYYRPRRRLGAGPHSLSADVADDEAGGSHGTISQALQQRLYSGEFGASGRSFLGRTMGSDGRPMSARLDADERLRNASIQAAQALEKLKASAEGAAGGKDKNGEQVASGGGGGGSHRQSRSAKSFMLNRLGEFLEPVGGLAAALPAAGTMMHGLSVSARQYESERDAAESVGLANRYGTLGEKRSARLQQANTELSNMRGFDNDPLFLANLPIAGGGHSAIQVQKGVIKRLHKEAADERLLYLSQGVKSQLNIEQMQTQFFGQSGDPFAQARTQAAVHAEQRRTSDQDTLRTAREAGMGKGQLRQLSTDLYGRRTQLNAAELRDLAQQSSLQMGTSLIQSQGTIDAAHAHINANPEGVILAQQGAALRNLALNKNKMFDMATTQGQQAYQAAVQSVVSQSAVQSHDLNLARGQFSAGANATIAGSQLRMSGQPIAAIRAEAAYQRPAYIEAIKHQYGAQYGELAGREFDARTNESVSNAQYERYAQYNQMTTNTGVMNLQASRLPYQAQMFEAASNMRTNMVMAKRQGPQFVRAAAAQGVAQMRLIRQQREQELSVANTGLDSSIRSQKLLTENKPIQAQASDILGDADSAIASNTDRSKEGMALLQKRLNLAGERLASLKKDTELRQNMMYGRDVNTLVSFDSMRSLHPTEDLGAAVEDIDKKRKDIEDKAKNLKPGGGFLDQLFGGAAGSALSGLFGGGGPSTGPGDTGKQVLDAITSIKQMLQQAMN